MLHKRGLKTAAQVSGATLLALLMSCAGTKFNTPQLDTKYGTIGSGTVEVQAQTKPPESRPPETKHKEESFDCRRCQRIADMLAENQSTLNHPATGNGWKVKIRDEIRALKQQREHCSTFDCEGKISRLE